MSKVTRSWPSPCAASATAAATPPAGPESAVPTASRAASSDRRDAAMARG